jgi:hypothetical protein
MTITTGIAEATKPGGVVNADAAHAVPPRQSAPRPDGPKPESKPDPNEALKTISMSDPQAKLGSSPDGLTAATQLTVSCPGMNGSFGFSGQSPLAA